MSSTTTRSSGVMSISYSFLLHWTLKAKQLNDLGNSSDFSVVRSDLYQFKTTKDFLRFYLEIGKPDDYCDISVKGSKMWSFKLAFPFLVSKERAFGLYKCELNYLSLFKTSSVPDEEDVTIYCVLNAFPVYPVSSAKEDDICPMEDQKTVDFEGMRDITLPENSTNEMVVDFIQRGYAKHLTVDKAIKIIGESKESRCEVLKILCVEYLLHSINISNMKKISKAAIDYGLPLLERRCLEKIANGDFKVTYS
ncbi:hypothetical protein AVEN_163189-1 [Araneus ventricosus]|uniref:Uncharacterized protein n=1 Tax=Araneus ventricosus TaxID=182803 RepID=A0A4Y2I6P0_ARAVE|nr:hypothetical protein AVEN_163189-1 [Araneus ventricosus]